MRQNIFILIIGAALSFVLGGCTTPKAVSQHEHHTYEVDTMAVKAMVDRHLGTWRQQMDSAWWERISQFTTQQQQSEHQQETITETVTTTLDSLGREIRQEQRTITRDITREQQILEQRLVREIEKRLQTVTDSLDASWQQRYDSLQARVAQRDSLSVSQTPVVNSSPWYDRLLCYVLTFVLAVVLAVGIYIMVNFRKMN